MISRLKTHLLHSLLALCVASCSSKAKDPREDQRVVIEKGEPAKSPMSYQETLKAARDLASKAKAAAEHNGRSALVYTRAAAEWIAVARLSGNYDDFAAADAMLNAAFALEETVPPYLLRARLNFSLHRFAESSRDLASHLALPSLGQSEKNGQAFKTAEALLRAQLAFEEGDYAASLKGYESVSGSTQSPGSLATLAYYHWQTGAFDLASDLYQRALAAHKDSSGEPVAWVHLQLGLMDLDRGRYADALVHYRDAEKCLPGYWLVDEHIAEILNLQGHADQAAAMLLDIIARTGNPEFMSALAEILLDQGKEAQAEAYVKKASDAYEARMLQFPEATYGHAVEHFLAHGTPERSLELATLNHRLRPNARAKVLLATAQLKAGLVKPAQMTIEEALATPMRSADMHGIAAEIYDAAKLGEKAQAHRELGHAINPVLESKPVGSNKPLTHEQSHR